MSKSRNFSIGFLFTVLLVMLIPSLCFGDSCNYTALVNEDGQREVILGTDECAPDCPEDMVIRYDYFTHKFSCDSSSEKRFGSVVLRKLKPVVRTTTYSF